MDDLPQELVDCIASYLSKDELKKTLLVSRPFQHATERASGGFTQFYLTQDNSEKFLDTYCDHRCEYLRHIYFETILPPFNTTPGSPNCRETSHELLERDESFTKQINFVFNTLKKLERHEKRTGKVKLTLDTPSQKLEGCFHRKFSSWRVHLLNPELLPLLECIWYLDIYTSWGLHSFNSHSTEHPWPLKLDRRTVVDLATKLPNLERLQCALDADAWPNDESSEAVRHYRRDWEGLRQVDRNRFAQALNEVHNSLSVSLKEVKFDFLQISMEFQLLDQRKRLPDLVSPALKDPFSSSLRLLSYRLRRIEIFAIVDETLFWPADGSTPAWPNLEDLAVAFHPASPSGSWYFHSPRYEGSTDKKGFFITEKTYPPLEANETDKTWDDLVQVDGIPVDGDESTNTEFRINPDNDAITPLLTSFARAASTMHRLRRAQLWSPLEWRAHDIPGFSDTYTAEEISQWKWGKPAWGVAYAKPSEVAFCNNPGEDGSRARGDVEAQ